MCVWCVGLEDTACVGKYLSLSHYVNVEWFSVHRDYSNEASYSRVLLTSRFVSMWTWPISSNSLLILLTYLLFPPISLRNSL